MDSPSSDKDLERIKLETGIERVYRDNIGAGKNIIERIL